MLKPTRYGGAWGSGGIAHTHYRPSALDGGEWSASRLSLALAPGRGPPDTHCTGGWVGLRAGLDIESTGKILFPRRGSNPGRPARSQTLSVAKNI
jgi:hypothetical protein